MKNIRHRVPTITLATLFSLLMVWTAAQTRAAEELQTINFDQIMQVNQLGDAGVTIKITFTAAQFQAWQQKYGQNKSLLRRDMNKYLSQYDTYDWDVTEKQMERQVTVTLKAKGTVSYKGNGQFEFRLPKTWRGGERTGTTFNYNYIEPAGPGVISQCAVKLTLPAGASNFRDQVSEQGDRVIQYTLAAGPMSRGWLLWLGLVSIALGAGSLALAYTSKTGSASPDPSPSVE